MVTTRKEARPFDLNNMMPMKNQNLRYQNNFEDWNRKMETFYNLQLREHIAGA
jgi:hypothetical protein